MTTTTAYSSTSDGYISSSNATYTTALAGGTFAVDAASATGLIDLRRTAGVYHVAMLWLSFDTSSIPDTDDISDVLLILYGGTAFTLHAASEVVNAYAIPAWDGTLSSGDWIDPRNLAGSYTKVASRTYPAAESPGSGQFTNNGSNLVNAINKTGLTKLLFVFDDAETAYAPGAGEREVAEISMRDDGANWPRLVVIHAAPVPSGSGALSMPRKALAGSGSIPGSIGFGAWTMPHPLNLAGTGIRGGVDATGALSMPHPVLAGAGETSVLSGTGALRTPALSLAGSGSAANATGALSMPVPVLAGSGTHAAPVVAGFSQPAGRALQRAMPRGRASYVRPS